MQAPVTVPDTKLKNSAKSIALKSRIQKDIVDKWSSVPDLMNLKNNQEFTELICNLVENMINNNKKKKINKKALVIDIITQLFKSNADERQVISGQIDYLFDNGMIKKKWAQQTMLKILKVAPSVIKLFL